MVALATIGNLLLAFFLVLLNAFFVATEFALVKVRPTRLDTLIEQGTTGAKSAREAVANLDDYLAVCQLGITIGSLGLGWVGEPAVAALIEPVLGDFLPAGSTHVVAGVAGFLVITFLHVTFGELAPKTISIQDATRISLVVAPPMRVFYYLFLPGTVVFNGTANAFTRLLGFPPASEADEVHTEEDLRMLVAQSSEEGVVEDSQQEMIEGVFDLQEIVAREVMVPHPDVMVLDPDASAESLIETIAEEGHTSYPVLDRDADEQVVGAVHVEDLVAAIRDDRSVTARDIAREVLIVPETRPVAELLAEFQRKQIQMAVVIDEWGAFEGILTVEDVLEEIVGDIRDEFDVAEQEPSITGLADGAYIIDGGTALRKVNEVLDTTFGHEDIETIGGLVLNRLGEAPATDDRVRLDGYAFDVEAVEGTRITEVMARDTDSSVDADSTDETGVEDESASDRSDVGGDGSANADEDGARYRD